MEEVRYSHPAIKLCVECSGVGSNHVFDSEDPFQRGDTHIETCQTCRGSGRVIVSKKTIVTIVPFSETM